MWNKNRSQMINETISQSDGTIARENFCQLPFDVSKFFAFCIKCVYSLHGVCERILNTHRRHWTEESIEISEDQMSRDAEIFFLINPHQKREFIYEAIYVFCLLIFFVLSWTVKTFYLKYIRSELFEIEQFWCHCDLDDFLDFRSVLAKYQYIR